MNADIIIVGAGPSGLCLAKSLSDQGLRITLVEQQSFDDISNPGFDGREIALTQHSAKLMQDLGLWSRIESQEISQLKNAKILDGSSDFEMLIPHQLGKHKELGWLVSNHLIRKAAYEAVADSAKSNQDITILTNQKVVHVETNEEGGWVRLANGDQLQGRLIVAADNRFSTSRRMMGIAAEMHDFGRNMLVCCMTHEVSHDNIAWEWFDYGQTLALLPMNPDPVSQMHRSSVVITVTSPEADALMQKSSQDFSQDVERRFKKRLGKMQLVSTKHAYPLVSVYPKRLVANRFATVGDAAVGMHPVTAHGFNFGLLGVESLSQAIIHAKRADVDIGNMDLLERYEKQHRRNTRPLFLLTRLITGIYTRESPPAKLLRKAMLRVGQRLTPLKNSIAASLSGA